MDGILIVDKEQNWTSHDVVAKLRGILGIKKIGHTGTLDPMATGVLPICIGKATKLCEYLTNADKVYRCTIKFGKATTTQDAWGEVQKISLKRPDLEMFRNVLMNFKGEQKQIPRKMKSFFCTDWFPVRQTAATVLKLPSWPVFHNLLWPAQEKY